MNADHPCHDTGVDPESRVYTLTAGDRANATDWSKRYTGRWPQICAALTTHKVGPKDGSCYVPGVLNGPVRNQGHVAEIHLAVIDLDAGNTLAEIEAAIARKGLAAAIASTHNHMATTTKRALKKWRAYRAEKPDGTPADFLAREKKLPRVVENAEILSIDEVKNEITFRHNPCPKYRVVLPLAKPWRASSYKNQAEAIDAWREIYRSIGDYLGLQLDEACARLQMFYFMPRCQNDGAAPEARVVEGRCLALDELAAPGGQAKNAADIEIEILEGLETKPGMEAVDVNGEVIDLIRWAAKDAKRFEIATALATLRPDVLTDGRSRGVRVGIRCPFEDQHSSPARDNDTSTVVVNASDSVKAGLTRMAGFAVLCLHNGCTHGGKGRDRLEHVAKMLEDGWLTVPDLTNPDFLVPEADAEEASERTPIVLKAGERSRVMRETEAVLRDPSRVQAPGWIFHRGHAPAVLRFSTDTTKLRAGKAEITVPPRTPYLVAAKPEHMAALLNDAFAFKYLKAGRDGKAVEVPCDCPADLARYVLANTTLLPLLSISRTPVLRDDGSVLEQPGYDARTGIFYAPEIEFPPIPEHPTQDDARRAYRRLCRPFRGFPFASEADKAAAVSEVLTIITRHLTPRAPAFLHNATEAGSGKTKLFDTVAIIALNSNAPLLNASILDDEAELKKVLTTLTLMASPFTVFDNVRRGGEITSPGLSNYLTATIYGDRLLGSNEEVKAATCTVLGLTGNSCEIAGDNTRRIVRIDLDAGVERPELREFDFDCEAEAREERGELVVAALTMLRAHALAGRPKVPGRGTLGSFEEWDRIVCGALVYAGAPDPLTLLDRTRTVDPERGRLSEVLRVMKGVGADRKAMKAGEIIRAAEAAKQRRAGTADEAEAQDWWDVLGRFGNDGVPSAKRLGRYLTTNAGRVVDGHALLREHDSDAKLNRFRVKVDEQPRADAGPAEEGAAGSTGFPGFYGVSDGSFLSDDETKEVEDVDIAGARDRDKPRKTPETPYGSSSEVDPFDISDLLN